ncbi:bifunctional diaminohydroxyphosphoribosylaminopyrimidine deaminase/5-amino-6-(5-phosphoribosylamino)uracil reductase RibD [Mesorhizobium sp. LHD-90]|uniref:bifunctional diaminohydroxyphosphoribosylaminopyrimidine deaminase/5-amino-6-(5-phosphoribosylamino)uracil reductase RibD n=1 Tax=Mesorhizobium sp. LHD-90 TaxID=3071414 RepID=UPI0027E13B98|nr:bifunctional diaminohydroxyphosphoribosylaminopyrimidine deaminase/5-amino-6-(5-phosphoribosylamino)uracil reductase RibD [Mesorhizobium sp. LHD-90]MDQ6434544.1 bifunctional diaminohydroxyphosphoribosylaminopyrimidine deaminase/5-amino-6-(5-phosphoribosylamino)uracil reductase RibD [Mesorhizobium sp. LHD-90]
MSGNVKAASVVTDVDRRFMAAAIRLSLWHEGLTGENPSVGALVVRPPAEGFVIVGRGVTALGGRPHAELQALHEAGEAARGATVYATLEPCSHIGKAPPCADALVAAGVARVVIATLDPDRRVAGRGVSILERAGIEVATGCLEDEARRAMAGFLSLKGRGRPFLTLKLAVSADGMIGRKGVGQVSITGAIARRAVQMMRVEHEAIMVGAGTVAEDDPLLTVRLEGLEKRSPTRVIVDPFARTPTGAKLFRQARDYPVLVLASGKAQRSKVEALRESGAVVQTVASDYRGRFDPREILRVLGVVGVKSVLLEGGAETASRFLDSGLVDRIALFVGASTVGDDGIPSPLTEATVPPGFSVAATGRYGEDRLIEYERTD